MSCIEATSPSPRPKGFEHELRHTRALAWAWSWLVQLQTTCWKMHYVALKHAPNNRGWCSNVLKLYMSKVVTVDRRQGEDMIRLEVNLLWERERESTKSQDVVLCETFCAQKYNLWLAVRTLKPSWREAKWDMSQHRKTHGEQKHGWDSKPSQTQEPCRQVSSQLRF